jgi:hypothetical protein
MLQQPDSLVRAFSTIFKNLRDKPPGGAKDMGVGWLRSFIQKLASAYVNTFLITKIGSAGTPVFDSTITSSARETAVVAKIDTELLQRNVLDPAQGYRTWNIITERGKPATPVTFSLALAKLTASGIKGFVQAK